MSDSPVRPTRNYPPRAVTYAQDAARHLKSGNIASAESSAMMALALCATHVNAMRVIATAQSSRGDLREAEATLRAALAVDPDDCQSRSDLAACLADQSRFGEAIELCMDPPPTDAQGWFQVGALHDRNANASAALQAATRALRISPKHVGARFLQGRALTACGQIDAAAAVYRGLVDESEHAAKAWFALLDLKVVRISDRDVTQIERIANRAAANSAERMYASFALGQACEQMGKMDNAVTAFDRANRISARRVAWNAEAYSSHVDAILSATSELPIDASSRRGDQVIFIVGMPRSGTTLVEQILAAHPDVVGAGELPHVENILNEESQRRGKRFPEWVLDASPDDWRRLGDAYLQRTLRWQSRRKFTDKLPENWPYVGAILAMLPGCRVIGCERDPIETAWSCYKQLFAHGRVAWSYDPASLAAYAHDARRLWLHFSKRRSDRCRSQSYEALLADLDAQVNAMLTFVGLPDSRDCLSFWTAQRESRTASAAQIRQPLNPATARRHRYGIALAPFVDAISTWRRDA